jgi:hypothetical protein
MHHLSDATKPAEMIVKNVLLAVAFTSAFGAGMIAQTSSSWSQGIARNATMHERNVHAMVQNPYWSNEGVSPRDPPFGKGNVGNDTFNRPSSADSRHQW